MDVSAPRILKATDGVAMGDPAGVRDRFLIDGADAGGRFALVQHLFAPRALAAPLHRHHREDEYMYVLYGRVGAVLGDDEVVGEPGDLVFKPRDQWHTFWNAGDGPAAVLELISPAGLEQFFRWLDGLTEPPTPEQLAERARPYDCDADPEGTQRIIERHGLTF
jgi:mannose-6-phosphate isomerase-like protein (cupin superfamily)